MQSDVDIDVDDSESDSNAIEVRNHNNAQQSSEMETFSPDKLDTPENNLKETSKIKFTALSFASPSFSFHSR